MKTFAVLALVVIAGLAVAVGVLVRLPTDCLHAGRNRDPSGPTHERPSSLRSIAAHVGGLLLIGIGLVLALPGVPGPGLLVVLAGLLLVDVPGKQRLLAALLSRPLLLRSLNRLRRRFSQPLIRSP